MKRLIIVTYRMAGESKKKEAFESFDQAQDFVRQLHANKDCEFFELKTIV
jgi:hypothetical protein